MIKTTKYITKPYTQAGSPNTEEHPPPRGHIPFVNSPYDKYPENSIPIMDIPSMTFNDVFLSMLKIYYAMFILCSR
jgi:hypothetical protein